MIVCRDEDLFTGFLRYRMPTRKCAKRRQQTAVLADNETRQAQRVACGSQAIYRMQMACQYIGVVAALRVVAKGKRTDPVWFVNNLHCQVGRRIAGVTVVVSPDKRQRQRRVAQAPAPDRVKRSLRVRRFGMQKIAEKQHMANVMRGKQPVQFIQIRARRTLRHGYAFRAEGRCLAKMDVCDDQHAARRPVRRPLRQQIQLFFGDGHQHGDGLRDEPRILKESGQR